MERILMVREIIRLDWFFREIRDGKDKFVAVDMREIFRRWLSRNFPHHIPPPAKHKSSTLTNDNIRIPGAYISILSGQYL